MSNPIAQSIQRQAENVLTTGQRFKRFDQIRQRHFWSTYRLYADVWGYIQAGDFDFFTVPVGQAGQGFLEALTPLETNWPGANRVADNQNLEVTELGVSCQFRGLNSETGQIAAAKLNSPNYHGAEGEILRNMVASITYLTNTVPLGMCTDFAQAAGPRVGQYVPNIPDLYTGESAEGDVIAGYDPTTLDLIGRNLVTNGFAAPGLRRRFTIPMLLQHGETFKFTLSIPAGRGPWVFPPLGNYSEIPFDALAVYDVRFDFWATESFVEKS